MQPYNPTCALGQLHFDASEPLMRLDFLEPTLINNALSEPSSEQYWKRLKTLFIAAFISAFAIGVERLRSGGGLIRPVNYTEDAYYFQRVSNSRPITEQAANTINGIIQEFRQNQAIIIAKLTEASPPLRGRTFENPRVAIYNEIIEFAQNDNVVQLLTSVDNGDRTMDFFAQIDALNALFQDNRRAYNDNNRE